MWFRMPDGVSGVSVDLQNFETEVKDAKGLGYFRAPDYLAAKILDLPGFVAFEPPEGLTELEDIPAHNSPHSNAIADLTAQLSTMTSLRDDANERLQIALRQVDSLGAEIKRLNVTIGELESKPNSSVKINADTKK